MLLSLLMASHIDKACHIHMKWAVGELTLNALWLQEQRHLGNVGLSV